jgi:hypothetical protein
VLNQHPTLGNGAIFSFLLVGQLLPAWFLVGLRDHDACQRKAHKARAIALEDTPIGRY